MRTRAQNDLYGHLLGHVEPEGAIQLEFQPTRKELLPFRTQFASYLVMRLFNRAS